MDFNAEQVLLRAIEHHKSGRLEEAEKLYRSILEVQPTHPDANHNIGVLAMGVNKPEAALPFLAEALQSNPNVSQFWLSYIDALIKAGKIDEANSALARGGSKLKNEHLMRIEILLSNQINIENTTKKDCDNDKIGWHKRKNNKQKIRKRATLKITEQRTSHQSLAISMHDEIDFLLTLFSSREFQKAMPIADRMARKYPENAFFWKVKGNILAELGEDELAIDSFNEAIKFGPNDRENFYNAGISYYTLGKFSQAEESFRKALNLDPRYAEAHNNLGNTLKAVGLLQSAELSYKAAIQLKPNLIEPRNNLGAVLMSLGRLDDAKAVHLQSIKLDIYNAQTYNNLGLVLEIQGQLKSAEDAFQKAIQLDSKLWDARINLSSCKMINQQYKEAEDILKGIISEHGNNALALNNLGVLFMDQGRLSEAAFLFKKAAQIKPDYTNAYNNLGYLHLASGDLLSAEAIYREALRHDSKNNIVFSNLIFMKNYKPDESGLTIKKEAIGFKSITSDSHYERVAAPVAIKSGKTVSIGLVSGDFYNHPVGYFMTGLIRSLDKNRLPIFVFYNNNKFDETTHLIKKYVSGWDDVYSISEKELALKIQSKDICVLIDLSGHTDKNRLPVFAYRPAPVQVSWLGYCGTTGLSQIDYILGDPYVTPESEEHHFVEKVWRLPETYWCFTPPQYDLTVEELPAIRNEHITFGCFNNLAKLNENVISLWAKILKGSPTSKLFLKTRQFSDQWIETKIREKFAQFGIGDNQLIIEGQSSRQDYLKTYNRVDIALDPFPFPGGTTSIEGLWMGVPFLTKKGNRFYSHNGETILHNIGLPEWIATDEDDYARKAIEFSQDMDTLVKLRKELRGQILASPLFDAERFAKNFEKAMFDIWEKHCSEEVEKKH